MMCRRPTKEDISRFAEFLGKGDGRNDVLDQGVGWYPEDAF